MSDIQAENRGLDDVLFDSIVSRFRHICGFNTFGFTLMYLASGKAGMQMVVGPEFSNMHRRAHGGLIGAALDTVVGVAAWTLDCDVVTLEMNLNYFAPIGLGDAVTCEGWVIHKGNTIVVGEGDMRDQKGRLIAKSRMTFYRVGELAGEENQEGNNI